MRVMHYYPRALVGDGGITNAVRKLSQGMVNAGAQVVVAHDTGVAPPGRTEVEWFPVRHRGRTGLRVPIGLERALAGADVLVLHSAWTLHNARAAAVARKLGVAYVPMPRGAYDPSIVARRRLRKKLWWVALERKLLHRSLAVHLFFAEERAHLERLGYRGPVIVAPNGVEPPEGVSWDGGRGGYVLWVGRFDPDHKGLDLLLGGLERLLDDDAPEIGRRGAKVVREEISWDAVARSWIEQAAALL